MTRGWAATSSGVAAGSRPFNFGTRRAAGEFVCGRRACFRVRQKLLGRSFATALLPRLFETNPRSHHKGATDRVRTGDQRLPVLCHCQLGQDIYMILAVLWVRGCGRRRTAGGSGRGLRHGLSSRRRSGGLTEASSSHGLRRRQQEAAR